MIMQVIVSVCIGQPSYFDQPTAIQKTVRQFVRSTAAPPGTKTLGCLVPK